MFCVLCMYKGEEKIERERVDSSYTAVGSAVRSETDAALS